MNKLRNKSNWTLLALAFSVCLLLMGYHFLKPLEGSLPTSLASEYFNNGLNKYLNYGSDNLEFYKQNPEEDQYFSIRSKSFYRFKLSDDSRQALLEKYPQMKDKDLDKLVQEEVTREKFEKLVQGTSKDWRAYKDMDPLDVKKPEDAVFYAQILYKDGKIDIVDSYVEEDENLKDFQQLFFANLSTIVYDNYMTLELSPYKGQGSPHEIFQGNEVFSVDKHLDTAKITVSMNRDQYQSFLEKSDFELRGMDLIKSYLPIIALVWFGALVLSVKDFESGERERAYVRFLDFFSWEVVLLLFFLWIAAFVTLYENNYDLVHFLKTYGPPANYLIFFAGMLLGSYTLLLTAAYIALRALQIKERGASYGLWEKTLLYKIVYGIRKIFKQSVFNLEQSVLDEGKTAYRSKKKLAFIGLAAIFLFFLFIVFGTNPTSGFSRLVLLFILLILFLVVIFFIHDFTEEMRRIIEGSNEIVKGNYAYKIPVEKTYFKGIANNFNRIASNLDQAVREAVDSAQVQSNLITNVSHDLKTPLTSVLNYADLLSKEDDPEKMKDYAKIIHEKSIRIQTLIDHLFEVSQSGKELREEDLQLLNIRDLLNQVLGEWEDQFTDRGLRLISHFEEDLFVMLDGDRAYRIFDNLCSNIYKYGLANTRVYVDAFQNGGQARILFRNISKDPLNKDLDFSSRFIRGDASRSGEGYGLGLAIAKSLVLQMRGHFAIEADGDLFKVKVDFPLASGKEEAKINQTT